MIKFYVIILVFLQIRESVLINCDNEPKSTEATLKKKLFCNKYDKSERPVKSHTDAVNVTMHMVLQNFDFDDNLQKLFLNVWLLLTWKDEYLTWNAMEYGGMKELIVESDDIWLPDMMPYSAYYSNNLDASCTTPKCSLESNGLVKCVPACEYHLLCISDFTNWPFDRQNCTVRFGMWSEYSKEVNLLQNGSSLASDETNTHNQWKILSVATGRQEAVVISKTETLTYPSLIFRYILERHSGSHCAMILTPVFVMVSFNLIALWLHCSSVERLFLLGANISIHFLFMQSLYWQIPFNGSAVPLFMIFFRDSLVLTASILVLSVYLRHLNLKEAEAPTVLVGFVTAITGSTIGQYIFTVKPSSAQDMEQVSNIHRGAKTTDESTADTAVLVGEEENVADGKTVGKSGVYGTLSSILDRLLCVGIVITYTFMLVTLIPRY
ncbi:neuronal acetylcholine receptor subunit beta-3-like [Toxorhynchites rutilus septentrionalis]|uniref:neuronal acetylcholine receptor subunit beta-3-like n=1 Tax=Toxorhynchites rutilus septentrionalis TaxID=329112 RepID=UPI0024790705|nr:neuronal acetylcholine receptor subunit beta-3-like [Toxorhynchites rutilus septentrionalis]XP_055639913.1 neuronal acetylcholine receptor subunit beta-3-like [Toxorhynchites rutilus septentrionalis]XP_055639914.1 neuronal acetylcholine receptor subunit beta-3-like [Toxorhynchites rutilus septentrionalis]XP_055639915.1 neuronal acetylcholine receptor subunit beta-3-like [Toxorhynchites rutilus septentrionalis]XP_055639916.1 neuronal acetylcholine receptor subunit beta-3-like [Toxorhynchites 